MLLELRGISKRFPGVVALDDVSIGFAKGEVHALAGENGAGKSTLIKVIAGRYRPDEGRVLFHDEVVEIADPLKASRMGISVVYQEYNLLPKLTVQDNVLLGREPCSRRGSIDRAAARSEVETLAARMNVSVSPDSYVADLGAAEAKIVEIMKALAAHVELLILDEPTAALPEKDVAALFAVIRSLRDAEVTVLYISHRLDEIFAIADRVTVLKDGKHVGTWPVAQITRDQLVRSMVGRELTDIFPPRRAAASGQEVMAGDLLGDGKSHCRRLVSPAGRGDPRDRGDDGERPAGVHPLPVRRASPFDRKAQVPGARGAHRLAARGHGPRHRLHSR